MGKVDFTATFGSEFTDAFVVEIREAVITTIFDLLVIHHRDVHVIVAESTHMHRRRLSSIATDKHLRSSITNIYKPAKRRRRRLVAISATTASVTVSILLLTGDSGRVTALGDEIASVAFGDSLAALLGVAVTDVAVTGTNVFVPVPAPTALPTDFTDVVAESEGHEGFGETIVHGKLYVNSNILFASTPLKPAFVATDFDYLLSEPTVADISLATATMTLVPTKHPTAYPTIDGYAVVEKIVPLAIVSTDLSFPLSQVEATNPMMHASLEAGFAVAIGFDVERVNISRIESNVAMHNRRLGAATSTLTFDVDSMSNSSTQVQKLKTNIVMAANEGSIVANVQKEAAARGVLVESLQTMPRILELNASDLHDGVRLAAVFVLVRTSDDAESSAVDDDDGDDGDAGIAVFPEHTSNWEKNPLVLGEIIGIVLCTLGIIGLLVSYCCCRRRKKDIGKEVVEGATVNEQGLVPSEKAI
jgi:hypothetical protein